MKGGNFCQWCNKFFFSVKKRYVNHSFCCNLCRLRNFRYIFLKDDPYFKEKIKRDYSLLELEDFKEPIYKEKLKKYLEGYD